MKGYAEIEVKTAAGKILHMHAWELVTHFLLFKSSLPCTYEEFEIYVDGERQIPPPSEP